MSKEEMTYESALAELQQIVESIESGRVGIDELETQMARADSLLGFCRERLTGVGKLIEGFGEST